VSLPMKAAEFDDTKRQTFKAAIAKTAGPTVRADHVMIAVKESTAVRRLLNQGIRIDVTVNVVDKRAADAIAARLTKDSINAGLTSVGLPNATILEDAAVVITANGNQTAVLEEEATLFLGPQTTVGVTFALSIVFAGVAAWILKTVPKFTKKTRRVLYLLDILDTLCDWASWTGTSLEGDFTFSNDQGGIVKWTLFVISIFGTVLFLVSTKAMLESKRFKYVLILQLGFENFAQGILYIIVASSQAATANVRASVFVGIVQALCFCAFQIYELNDLARGGEFDADEGGNHGGGEGGNPGARGATTTAGGGGGCGIPPPPAPATSGRSQPIETSTGPAPTFMTSTLGFPSGSSSPAGRGFGGGFGQPNQLGSQDFGGGGFGGGFGQSQQSGSQDFGGGGF